MTPRSIWFCFCLIGVLVTASGCPSEPTTEPPTPEPEPGIGVDPTVRAAPGEVRGGILPADPADFAAAAWGGITAEARPGDLVLYNDRVRFAIRREAGHGYVGVAGALIDADIVRPEGQLGRDTLEEAFLAFGIGALAGADTVELVADGSDGQPAVVRVTGRDERWRFVEGVVEADDPLTPPLDIDVVTEYVLAADSNALLVRTTLSNPNDDDVRANALDGLIAAQEDLDPYGSGEGLSPGALDEPAAIGTVGRNGEATMLLYRADGPLNRFGANDLLSSSGIELIAHGWQDIPAGQQVVLERYRAIGADPAEVEASRMAAQGITTGLLSGTVTSGGAPVEGARVHLVQDGATPVFQGFAVSHADGTYSLRAPPGDYSAVVTGTGPDEIVDLPDGAGRYAPFTQPLVNARQLAALRGDTTPSPLRQARGHGESPPMAVTLPEGGATADLDLPPAGTLRLQITDGDGAALPGYVEVTHAGGAPTSPIDDAWRAGLGLPARTGSALRAWTGDGDITLPLAPGEYSVTVSASPRHTRASVQGITVTAAGVTESVTLTEVLARDGWLAMDSHLHAAPSTDGTLPMEDRLIACAAAGVELPVTTDHDRMVPYGPLVPALGLEGRLRVIDGVEVSPVLRGHFNLFPATGLGPSVINGGAPAWWQPFDDTDALFARIREAAPDDALLQINHGRESSGMMSAASYEPSTGEPFRPDFWSWGFDLVEIVNSRSVGYWEETSEDWFSWLNIGQRRIPVGVSDSHGRTSPCGYGRTDVFLDTTVPSEVTPEALAAAIRAGHVVVSGGVTLRVSNATGELPGDTVTAAGVDLQITVSGPDHIRPDVVRVLRNGEVVMEQAITGESTDGIWWTGSFQDSPDVDSWYAVEVEGTQAIGGAYGGAVAYALANAVFLDRAGDGWTPPGLP